MTEYSVEEVRARFEAHHGITWEAIQSLPIGSGSRMHLESYYKRHFDTWQAAYASRIAADKEVGPTEAVVSRAVEVFLDVAPEWSDYLVKDGMRAALHDVWPNPPAQAAQVDVGAIRRVAKMLNDRASVLLEIGEASDAKRDKMLANKLTAALQDKTPVLQEKGNG